jgi:hypothetical protein
MPDEEKIKCPSCGWLVDESAQECPSCGIVYSTVKQPFMVIKKESESLVNLLSVSDAVEAEMIRMFLEEEKIPCIISQGGVTSVLGAVGPSGFTRIRILVPRERAKDAILVMQKYHKWDEKELERYLTMLDEIE